MALAGPRAARNVPYYSEPSLVGAVCATPVLDHGHARGVLVVDRAHATEFSPSEQELLQAATRFILRAIENERVFVQLEAAKIEQGKLYRAAGLLAAATTEVQVIEAGVGCAREFAAFDFAIVTLFGKTALEHEICAASGEGTELLVGKRFKHNAGLCPWWCPIATRCRIAAITTRFASSCSSAVLTCQSCRVCWCYRWLCMTAA